MKLHPALSVLLALTLLLLTQPCSAKVVYVKWDSPGPPFDGTSWDTAFHTVQAGLNASVSGDEVWVAKGTYVGCITLKDGVGLYGGFVGAEVSRDQRDFGANETILDGNKTGSVVISPSGATETTLIDGFTVKNGLSDYGGGVYCFSSSPAIRHNKITANSGLSGGGISCRQGSAPVIEDNMITANQAYSGGGIHCWTSCSPMIIGNTISLNTATSTTGYGGGMFISLECRPTVCSNVVINNSSACFGGGIACYARGTAPLIDSNLIAKNAAKTGGGVFIWYAAPVVSNNTVADNTADSAAGISISVSTPKIANNIVAFCSSGIRNSQASFRNNCVYNPGGVDYDNGVPGTGDINVDPMFVDRASGDYHLAAGSPCVDAGWALAPRSSDLDMDGEYRLHGVSIDIGADELWASVDSVRDARLARDGLPATLASSAVSAVFQHCFYVESDDRTAGIQVTAGDQGLVAGVRIGLIGTVRTNSDGERYIEATSVTVSGTGLVVPVGLRNSLIGGGDWFYSPVLGSGQAGQIEYRHPVGGSASDSILSDVNGLNNIGLLVRTWGKVAYTDVGFFYLDDGSHLDDGSGHIGIKVMTEGLPMPALDSYVKVTGISSCYKRDGNLFRLLRATEITAVSA